MKRIEVPLQVPQQHLHLATANERPVMLPSVAVMRKSGPMMRRSLCSPAPPPCCVAAPVGYTLGYASPSPCFAEAYVGCAPGNVTLSSSFAAPIGAMPEVGISQNAEMLEVMEINDDAQRNASSRTIFSQPTKASFGDSFLKKMAGDIFGAREKSNHLSEKTALSPPHFVTTPPPTPPLGQKSVPYGFSASESETEASKELEHLGGASQQPKCKPPDTVPPHQVLSLLNMKRTVLGCIPSSPEVMLALAGIAWEDARKSATATSLPLGDLEAFAAQLLLSPAVRPPTLPDDDVWVTVLALAYLRKHLGGDKGVWYGLEAKALEWLASIWQPKDHKGRSVGSMVLAAMKLV